MRLQATGNHGRQARGAAEATTAAGHEGAGASKLHEETSCSRSPYADHVGKEAVRSVHWQEVGATTRSGRHDVLDGHADESYFQ
jgi:hypothetical protein